MNLHKRAHRVDPRITAICTHLDHSNRNAHYVPKDGWIEVQFIGRLEGAAPVWLNNRRPDSEATRNRRLDDILLTVVRECQNGPCVEARKTLPST